MWSSPISECRAVTGFELLNRVKEFNNRLPVVIFITGHADIGIEDAYDKGADVIFSKPFDRKALHAAVERAVTPKEKLWPNRAERFAVDFSIELKFPHLETAIKARGLSIGRGGLFVALDDRLPAVMSPVSFQLEFSDEPRLHAITGAGIVRWVRKTKEGDFRTGCGIEITHIDGSSRQEFIRFVEGLKCKAFIPKI